MNRTFPTRLSLSGAFVRAGYQNGLRIYVGTIMMVGNAGNKRIRGCPQTNLLCRNTVRVAETALDAAYLGLFLSSLLLLGKGDFDRRTILKEKRKMLISPLTHTC